MAKKEIFEELQHLCSENVYIDEPMCKHTSFKIGGNADFFVKVSSVKEIQDIQKYVKLNNIPLHIIGNGSNLLVSDEGIRGIVLKNNIENIEIEEDGEFVNVTLGAGIKLSAITHTLCAKGISGMEELSGIPGTIGGALRMNAGAYGKEIKDIVIETKCLNENGEIIELSNEDQQFEYRNSIFKNNKFIILETKIKLQKDDKEKIRAKMDEYLNKRITSQPMGCPSAGSTFKRGNGFITAKVIDECGLKGYGVGGAEVSTKHAGFIINKGNASAKDVLELIKYVKNQVFEKTGLKIEEEIEFIK